MNMIPAAFLTELNQTIQNNLYNNSGVAVAERPQNTSTVVYLYDYIKKQSAVITGSLLNIIGQDIRTNADMFHLPMELSDCSEIRRFLNDIQYEVWQQNKVLIQKYRLTDLKFSYEYKVKRNRGDYAWLLHQMTILSVDANGQILSSLNTITDITEFKCDDKMRFVLSKKEADQLYTSLLKISHSGQAGKNCLSEREREIVELIRLGKSSIEIADKLCLSTHTVHKHRYNILKKTGAKNATELLLMIHD